MAFFSSSWWLDIISLACGLLLLVYLYFRYSYTYWKKRGISYVQPTFPFGNVMNIVLRKQSFGEVFKKIYDDMRDEKLVGAFVTTHPTLVLRDLEVIKSFLVKDFGNFHDRGIFVNFEVDYISEHLFLVNGQQWRNLRAKLSPTFTSGKMKMMFQTMVSCAEELKVHLKKPADIGENVEIKDVLARFTTDIISSCAFGIQCNCLKEPDAEFRKYSVKLFDPSVKSIIGGILNFTMPAFSRILKIPSMDADVQQFFMRIVEETIEFREKNGIERNDFLQLLIRLRKTGYVDLDAGSQIHDDVHRLTIRELASNVFVFFLAGFETSSTTMSYCIYELALNPLIQDRLRGEVEAVMKKHGELTYDTIQDLPYMDKVVSETLRKYPPVPILNRQCTKKYRMSHTGQDIEPGVNVIVPVLAIQHDPQYYPDPDVFDPERFTEEAKASRPHFSYLPFGEGPRNCIGLRFGLMQTKVGLVTLLSNYEFSVCEKTAIPLVVDPTSFVHIPKGGIYLKVTKCKSNTT